MISWKKHLGKGGASCDQSKQATSAGDLCHDHCPSGDLGSNSDCATSELYELGLNMPKPLLFHLWNWDLNTYFMMLLWKVKE